MSVNQTYCGDDFAIYTYIESLWYTHETNIIYDQFKKKHSYKEHPPFLYPK